MATAKKEFCVCLELTRWRWRGSGIRPGINLQELESTNINLQDGETQSYFYPELQVQKHIGLSYRPINVTVYFHHIAQLVR
jgi:hypothetical protein